uniref:Centrosomal protein 68 n=1 Tax=Hippocampus comes TaxID=109280 RepID=A0A3Q2X949_HIPCM
MIFSPMDAVECSRPWKFLPPDTCVSHSMRLNATDVASGKRATDWEKEQTHKSVTMAPTSRYLTERQYVMRKPLFYMEQASILKKTPQQQHQQKAKPVVGLTLTRNKSIQCDLPSNILELQKKDRPERLQLTSTVLYPTYTPTPRLSYSKRDQTTELKKQNLYSLAGQSRRQTMSYHEANYWDCAIPKSLPTSTNRHTASWDPNQEYQALLDYTYPLRPGQMDRKWDSAAFLGDSRQQQDLNLVDSGIELDNLRTTSPSGSDLNLSNTMQTEAWDRMDQKINSTGVDSSALVSRSLSSELFLDTLGLVMDKEVGNCHQGRSQHHHQYAQPSSSIAFIHATSVLPQSQSVGGDFDKEFWALPDHLEEVQLLTRQVSVVELALTILSKVSGYTNSQGAVSTTDHSNLEAMRRSPSSWMESVGPGLTQDSLKEVETLVEQLCGIHLRDSQKGILEEQDHSCSLMQRTRMFCSLLEQYIHWLYKVSEKMDMLARPTVDNENVKRSLAEYQKFQQELRSHQRLISHVLQTGELLLGCMDGTSPCKVPPLHG